MDIEILKEFITLSEILNFSETAKRHYITQPVLSKHISQLEAEIGALLFYRNRQTVSLTDAGKVFLSGARDIVDTYSRTVQNVRVSQTQFNSSFKFAFLDAAARNYLSDYIRAFSEKYSACSLELISCNIPESYQYLDEHKCDVALTVQLPSKNDALYEVYPLYRDPLCLVLPENHPLAARDSVTFEDVKKETFLMASPDLAMNYQDFIQHVMSVHNIQNVTYKSVGSVEQGFLLVASGLGISIVPSHQKYFASSDVKLIPLAGDDCFVNVVLLWRKDNPNPNIDCFISVVKAMKE